MYSKLFVPALLFAIAAPIAHAQAPSHPLDPLTASEISVAAETIRGDPRFGSEARFALIDLAEPSKDQVRDDLADGTLRRAARAVGYDWATRRTIDVVVDLQSTTIRSFSESPETEPPVRNLITARVNEAAKGSEEFRQAMADAGVPDLSRVNVLAGIDEDTPLAERDGDRLVRGNPYMMDERIEGMGVPLAVIVNLTRGEVVAIERQPGQWRPSDRSAPDNGREPLARLDIEQPEGESFMIEGHEIRWQNWRFRYGVHMRRGLELYDVRYADVGEERPILYRASVSETLTPYGDPEWGVWYPLDEGDYGLASYGIRSAVPEADAPPNAVFRPATLHDHLGAAFEVPRAVTVYERDAGVLWRHANESRRARELVIAYFSTIDNYDYVFNWIFRQDGRLRVEAELTGIINYGTTARQRESEFAADTRSHRTLVAPGVTGPIHQHFFSYRLDFDVDGAANTVVEAETEAEPVGRGNRDGHWFVSREQVLATEQQAQRNVNPAAGRTWRVVNESRLNALGRPTGYALVPGGNVAPAAAPIAPSRRKVRFVDHHLWVTRFAPAEMHAAGDYLPPGVRGGGLPAWAEANEPLRDRDVVLWYTFGITHVVRPEDFPIMPTHTAGFNIVPFGFFARNPALDVAGP